MTSIVVDCRACWHHLVTPEELKIFFLMSKFGLLRMRLKILIATSFAFWLHSNLDFRLSDSVFSMALHRKSL